jgi:hypothetical protein
LAPDLAGHLNQTVLGVDDGLVAGSTEGDRARWSDGELTVRVVKQNVMVAQDGRGKVDLGAATGGDGFPVDHRVSFLDWLKRYRKAADLQLLRRRCSALLAVERRFRITRQGQTELAGESLGDPELGITRIDPCANPLAPALGKRQVNVDDGAIVVERDGNRDGFGSRLSGQGSSQHQSGKNS